MRWTRKSSRTLAVVLLCLIAGLWLARRTVLRTLYGFPASTVVAQPISATKTQTSIVYDFDGAIQNDGLPSPWQSRVIVGQLGVSLVDALELHGHHALEINCRQSHFVLYNGSRSFDPNQFPILDWSWKGTTLPTNGDVRTHGEFYFSSANHNDAGMQVLVGFEGNHVISYVWDSTAPIGTEVDEWSPVATIKTRVIESGSAHLGSWQHMTENIVKDYQHLYGVPPGAVLGVSVQTNSNHTASSATGLFGPIRAVSAAAPAGTYGG